MPIEIERKVRIISQDDFHKLDYIVTGLAFSIHNDLGRFWNEKIYQRELRNRCIGAGLQVAAGTAINVSHKDFSKKYFLDLLVEDAALYELKAINALREKDQGQILNYLFLSGLCHGKLLNFGASSLDYHYVSTTIRQADRFNFTIDDKHWQTLCMESEMLKSSIVDLLFEWGAYLDIHLYKGALFHFLGGEEHFINHMNVINGSQYLGCQKMNLLTKDVCFHMSTIVRGQKYYEIHLYRILRHTD